MIKRDISKFDNEDKRERYDLSKIKDFIINGQKYGLDEIMVLYGFRGKARTVLMELAAVDCSKEKKCSFYLIELGDDMEALYEIVKKEHEQNNTEVLFLDEITNANDFLNDSAWLANNFAKLGMRIIIAGKNTHLIELAEEDALFGRTVRLATPNMKWSTWLDRKFRKKNRLEKSLARKNRRNDSK